MFVNAQANQEGALQGVVCLSALRPDIAAVVVFSAASCLAAAQRMATSKHQQRSSKQQAQEHTAVPHAASSERIKH